MDALARQLSFEADQLEKEIPHQSQGLFYSPSGSVVEPPQELAEEKVCAIVYALHWANRRKAEIETLLKELIEENQSRFERFTSWFGGALRNWVYANAKPKQKNAACKGGKLYIKRSPDRFRVADEMKFLEWQQQNGLNLVRRKMKSEPLTQEEFEIVREAFMSLPTELMAKVEWQTEFALDELRKYAKEAGEKADHETGEVGYDLPDCVEVIRGEDRLYVA